MKEIDIHLWERRAICNRHTAGSKCSAETDSNAGPELGASKIMCEQKPAASIIFSRERYHRERKSLASNECVLVNTVCSPTFSGKRSQIEGAVAVPTLTLCSVSKWKCVGGLKLWAVSAYTRKLQMVSISLCGIIRICGDRLLRVESAKIKCTWICVKIRAWNEIH